MTRGIGRDADDSAPLNNKLLTEISDSLFELKLVYPTNNIIIGDFNMVMDEALDRFPPKFITPHPNLILVNFCLNNNVVSTWRAGNPNIKPVQTQWDFQIENWLLVNLI